MIKEVEVLERNGYSVTLLGWDRDDKTSSLKQKNLKNNLEEITLALKSSKGVGSIPFLFIWWCFELFWLIKEKYDCIHALNFNSIIPAIIVGRLKNKPVMYEVLDTQTDEGSLPQIVRHIVLEVDKIFMRFADAIVLVDEMQIEEFGGIPNSETIVVYDSPPDLLDEVSSRNTNEIFTIFYAGKLDKAKRLNLGNIFAAISDVEGIRMIIAGYGDQVNEIKEWAKKVPEKIDYVGRLNYLEVLKKSVQSDLLFSIRDPLRPTHKYICGSKIFEAMMCAKPILVSEGTATARKVAKARCGILIDANNIQEIKMAIVSLKENKVKCIELGKNGRKAYETIYSWKIMKERLLNLYSKILD